MDPLDTRDPMSSNNENCYITYIFQRFLNFEYVNLNGFPYIDRDVGGSAIGLRDNIGALLDLIDDETKIIPGHGPLATKADLKSFYSIVSESISVVQAFKEQGKSLEEIQQAGLPKKFEGVVGFMPAGLWIQFVFDSLND